MPLDLRLDEKDAKPAPLFSTRRLRSFLPRFRRRRTQIRILPIISTLRDYSLSQLKSDVRAGINVALLDLPQGMAYALIAGLPYLMGVYASAIASFIGPVFASSRFIMLGPTNAIAVLTLSAFLGMGFSPEQSVVALPLLLIMIGLLMIVGGFLGVASMINYVSRSVVTGYITAAAFLIVIKQLRNVLGISTPQTSTFFDAAIATIAAASETHWPTLALALCTIAVSLILSRLLRKLPNVAVTLVIMYFVSAWFEQQGWTIRPLSDNPLAAGQWPLSLPVFSFELMGQLVGPALAIAFLSLLESSSIATTLAARSGDLVNVNQQMVSMGIANLGCAFGSGMPISGSLTRSALNYSSGASTAVSSLVSASILIIGILLLAPYMARVPMPALSALVILVGVSLINRRNIRIALGSTNSDATVFLVTFIAGLLLPLDTAIFIGVGTSVVLFIRKAGAPAMVEYAFSEGGKEVRPSERLAISLLHIEGNLFFGSSDVFLQQTRVLTADPNIRVVILRLRNAHNLDATCAQAIEQLVRFAREKGRHVLISGAHPEVVRVLRNSGVLAIIGPENVFREDPENPTRSTSAALKRAQQLVGERLEVRLFVREGDESASDRSSGSSRRT